MSKAKLVFNQTLMISTAILFGLGIQALVLHILGDVEMLEWNWYIPLSIIFTGLLCSIPSVLIIDWEGLSHRQVIIRILLHFISILAVVTLCGYLFRWYTCWQYYIPILVLYVLIYCFVWVATGWLSKADENRINEALKDIRDQE